MLRANTSPVRMRRSPRLPRRRRINLSIRILRRLRAQMPHRSPRCRWFLPDRLGTVHHGLSRVALHHPSRVLIINNHHHYPFSGDRVTSCRILLPHTHKWQRRTPSYPPFVFIPSWSVFFPLHPPQPPVQSSPRRRPQRRHHKSTPPAPQQSGPLSRILFSPLQFTPNRHGRPCIPPLVAHAPCHRPQLPCTLGV
jgi:hypothetical protein